MNSNTLTVANALKTVVSASFNSVGFMTRGTPEQAAAGKTLPKGIRPPCVLILAGDGICTDSTLTRRQTFQLVLLDELKGTDYARTTAAWTRLDALLALFPPDGTQSGETVFLPESFRLMECGDARAAACLTVTAATPA